MKNVNSVSDRKLHDFEIICLASWYIRNPLPYHAYGPCSNIILFVITLKYSLPLFLNITVLYNKPETGISKEEITMYIKQLETQDQCGHPADILF